MLIDEFLPVFDVVERHRIHVKAAADRVYHTVRSLDMSGSIIVRSLFRLRELPALLQRGTRRGKHLGITLDGLLKSGFILLGENPAEELLLGVVGRFWTRTGDLLHLDHREFQDFKTSGYAKAAWNFFMTGTADRETEILTETRVYCLGDAARRQFLRYWFFIAPFSGMIRKEMLRVIKRNAENKPL